MTKMTMMMKVMRMVNVFLRRQVGIKKLIICTIGAINMYYINYMHKEPCMVSYNIGIRWLNEVFRGYWKQCVIMFMMDITTLLSLCNDLETQYNLNPLRRMNIIGKVTMFIYTQTIGKCMKDYNIQVTLLITLKQSQV